MAFTTNLTGTAQIDDSIIQIFDQSFLLEVGQNDIVDPFATVKTQIAAEAISFTRYSQLTVSPNSLTEDEDVVSEAVADSKVTLIPVEEGKAVTRTELASLQSGGKIDTAIPILVAQSAAAYSNARATTALLASTNVITPGNKALGSILATDVLDKSFANRLYNKLSRKGNGVPTIAGSYVLFAHDDVINDLREDGSAGSWIDISKYSAAGQNQLVQNEVGMFKGFRVVKNNDLVGVDQTGAGTVDLYPIIALGFNGLGKAESLPVQMRATGPFDKLGRMLNVGWYGVYKYGIIEPDAVWVGYVASSLGNNAA